MDKGKTSFSKKQKADLETSESITRQIENFLSAGGRIEQVQSGVSGVPSKAEKKKAELEAKNKEHVAK